MLYVLLAVLCSMLTGVTAVYALLPRRRASRRVLAKVTIGAAVGMLAGGYLFLLSLMFSGGLAIVTVALDLLGLVIALLMLSASRRMDNTHEVPMLDQPSPSTLGQWLLLPILFAIAIAWIAGTNYMQAEPHGHWDAWTTWNLKARFFYLGGEDWTDAFNPSLTGMWHDYPLLLPLTVSHLWVYAGSDALWVPQAVAMGSLFLAGATMFGLLWAKRGLALASLGVLTWTSAWNLIYWASAQYADIPMAWFVVASAACLALGITERERPWGWWLLSGVLASAVASTKNEGLLFCGVISVVAVFIALLRDGKAGWRNALILIAAMLPGVLLVLTIKARIGIGDQQYFGGGTRGMIDHITDWSRHRAILEGAGAKLRETFDWWMLVPLVGLAIATGVNRNTSQRIAALGCLLIALLMAAGYYFALLNSRMDLAWHTRTSTERLALHIWPLLCVGFFLLLRSPEELQRADTVEADVVAPAKPETK